MPRTTEELIDAAKCFFCLSDDQKKAAMLFLLNSTFSADGSISVAGNYFAQSQKEFTRPANTTAYTAGDVVSNSTVATTPLEFNNLARFAGGSGYIVGARVSTNKASITPRIRVHLFNIGDATLAADNAAYSEIFADRAKRIGYFDLPAMSTPAGGTGMSRTMDLNNLRIPFVCAAGSRSVFAVLEALDGFATDSEQIFSVTLCADLN